MVMIFISSILADPPILRPCKSLLGFMMLGWMLVVVYDVLVLIPKNDTMEQTRAR